MVMHPGRKAVGTAARTTFAAMMLAGLAGSVKAEENPFRGQIEQVVADYLAEHPEKVEAIVKDYIARNPQVLSPALADLLKRPAAMAGAVQPSLPLPSSAPQPATAPIIKRPSPSAAPLRADADMLMSSPHQVVLGNPAGKITMVEFFDYNCGYCKRALGDTLALLKDEPDLRIVLKEFPILGPGSSEAAKVAVAVRMQDPTGVKYLAFHQKLLGTPGYIDRARALSAAAEAGLDAAKLGSDLETDEIAVTLAESAQLAQSLGINGTPSYVIGGKVIPGAIGVAGLRLQLKATN